MCSIVLFATDQSFDLESSSGTYILALIQDLFSLSNYYFHLFLATYLSEAVLNFLMSEKSYNMDDGSDSETYDK